MKKAASPQRKAGIKNANAFLFSGSRHPRHQNKRRFLMAKQMP
jgi:hypothetical protein